jgi:hypothetical protein
MCSFNLEIFWNIVHFVLKSFFFCIFLVLILVDETHWDLEYVEIHNPNGEPPGTSILVIYLADYEKAKRELEAHVGNVLPSLIPSCFGARSKFTKRTFLSSEEIKVCTNARYCD